MVDSNCDVIECDLTADVDVVCSMMELVVRAGEPYVTDEVLGMRLGYAQPRKVKELIVRLVENGKLPGLLTETHTARYQSRPGVWQNREVVRYFLNERNALRVIRHCETDKADAVMEEVFDVFLAYRHNKLPPSTDLGGVVNAIAELAKNVGALVETTNRRIDAIESERAQSSIKPLSNGDVPANDLTFVPSKADGYRLIFSTFNNRCAGCHGVIKVDDPIMWKAGGGAYCAKCSGLTLKISAD